MKLPEQLIRPWRQDPLLKTVAKNTGYLFSGTAVSTLLTTGETLLVTLLLGVSEYGVLGMIFSFTSNINRLLSFRMGEMVVKYAGQYLATEQREQSAAVIKIGALAEIGTALLAYLLLYLLAPLAAVNIVGGLQYTVWIRLYGLALLSNMLTETATAVLQIGGHYRSQAGLQMAQSALTFGGVAAAYLLGGDLGWVLMAYLGGKVVYGIGLTAAAVRWLRPMLGAGWAQAPLGLLPGKRELARFALSTNVSATINLLVRDSELLWIGYFLSAQQAGYYKFALTIMSLVLLPINPFIQTTFPEISKAVARLEWSSLRNLLRRTSAIAAAWTIACLGGILLLGSPILNWYKAGEYAPAWPLLIILIAGYGTANVFFWNRPLLLALGLPNVPLRVTAVAGLIKTGLMFVLVRPFGYLMQGLLLAAYFIVSVGAIVWRGVAEVNRRSVQEAAGEVSP
ncbi:MAG TPA: lipopolysaccharide biosynthesis protein [Anaerolineaceae bacterium]|nr:lipopolysaccharide biosynthesis protein [Anaerolineaceae bacterium]